MLMQKGEPMSDCMTFPNTVEEFMEQYKIVDTDGIYMSKGAELVPIFRMRQWFEHLPSAQRTGRWIFETLDGTPGYRPTVMFCSKCGRVSIANYSYCPNCGAKMEETDERT